MKDLPNGVEEFIEFLAGMAKGYDNHLKWNEEARFKADLMNVPQRWKVISPEAFKERCLAHGMRPEDANLLTGYLRKQKGGRRLVPQRGYRDYKFPLPVTDTGLHVDFSSPDW